MNCIHRKIVTAQDDQGFKWYCVNCEKKFIPVSEPTAWISNSAMYRLKTMKEVTVNAHKTQGKTFKFPLFKDESNA